MLLDWETSLFLIPLIHGQFPSNKLKLHLQSVQDKTEEKHRLDETGINCSSGITGGTLNLLCKLQSSVWNRGKPPYLGEIIHSTHKYNVIRRWEVP